MLPFKVSYHTLGCKLNFAETSSIARLFDTAGCARAAASEADICVVNSCSVTEHADKKCRNLVRRLHRFNPKAIIVVTGCYAELRPEQAGGIEGVALVVGNKAKGEVCRRTLELAEGRIGIRSDCRPVGCGSSEFFPAYSVGDRTRSFLKVQDGCDYCCTYCTIHAARGHSRNLPIKDAVSQAMEIAAAGAKEIVITGVNTGDYGRTSGESFPRLLRELDKIQGIGRYRISSIEPNLLTDEIISLCAGSPRFMPHFHIPLQSGSDAVLRRMGRRYDSSFFRGRIESVKRLMPDAFIGIDVVAGFPGETEVDFRDTVSLLEELRPAYLHVFPFSERPGTPAASFRGKIPDAEKTRRAAVLDTLCRKLHTEFYERFAHTRAEVLFEGVSRSGYVSGYTRNYLRVRAPYDKVPAGSIRNVRLGTPSKGPVFTVTETAP